MELTLCVCVCVCVCVCACYERQGNLEGKEKQKQRDGAGEGSQAEQTKKKKKRQRRGENSHPQQMCCEAFVSGWQVHYHRLMRSLVLPVASIRGALPPIPPPSIRSDINSHSGTECTHSQAHTHTHTGVYAPPAHTAQVKKQTISRSRCREL